MGRGENCPARVIVAEPYIINIYTFQEILFLKGWKNEGEKWKSKIWIKEYSIKTPEYFYLMFNQLI